MSKSGAAQLALSVVTLMLACSGGENPPAPAAGAQAGDAGKASSPSGQAGSDSGEGGGADVAGAPNTGGADSPADAGEASGGAPVAAGGAGLGGSEPDGGAGEGPIDVGPEQCFDGRDNDLNDATDCADAVCEQAC